MFETRMIYEDIWWWLEDIKGSFWASKILLTESKRELKIRYRITTSFIEIMRALYPPLNWLFLKLEEKISQKIWMETFG